MALSQLGHCIYLLFISAPGVNWSTESLSNPDQLLVLLCYMRLFSAIFRPFFWIRHWRSIRLARIAANPEEVARRLLAAQREQELWWIEKALLYFYYTWLVVALLISGKSVWLGPEASGWVTSVWRHAWLNVLLVLSHRVACVCYFFYLMHADIPRGVTVEYLDAHSKVLAYEQTGSKEVDECGICYAEFESSAVVRVLRCNHFYHAACVDGWLTRHRANCPLCLAPVGDKKTA